ncbi:MAG: hypothetical protein OK452_07565 [Thaumarchaeota archaeon]|nr:hypothetical protein [Nitrososphaerota archaeon]
MALLDLIGFALEGPSNHFQLTPFPDCLQPVLDLYARLAIHSRQGHALSFEGQSSPPMPIVVVDIKKIPCLREVRAGAQGTDEAVKGNPTTPVILRAEALKLARPDYVQPS